MKYQLHESTAMHNFIDVLSGVLDFFSVGIAGVIVDILHSVMYLYEYSKTTDPKEKTQKLILGGITLASALLPAVFQAGSIYIKNKIIKQGLEFLTDPKNAKYISKVSKYFKKMMGMITKISNEKPDINRYRRLKKIITNRYEDDPKLGTEVFQSVATIDHIVYSITGKRIPNMLIKRIPKSALSVFAKFEPALKLIFDMEEDGIDVRFLKDVDSKFQVFTKRHQDLKKQKAAA